MQTFTGIEYLKIDVANSFGHDKLDWSDRIAWFDENEADLEGLVAKADEPALFHAGVRAFRKSQAGQPSGYPISLDATCSGIQLLSALTGDRKAAALCNLIDTGRREDAYTSIYEAMLVKVGGASSRITRKDTKTAIMTSLYASEAEPKRIFGDGPLLETFYEVMREVAPGPWEFNEAMLAEWNEDWLAYGWTTPDNFHVRVRVEGTVEEPFEFLGKALTCSYTVNKPIEQGRSLGANLVHSVDGMVVREMDRRCNYDPAHVRKLLELIGRGWTTRSKRRAQDKTLLAIVEHYEKCGFLSARVLDFLDEENIGLVDPVALTDLLESLPAKPFPVLAVHDCFRCLPNYGNDLRRQYARILAEIAASDMLAFLVSQVVGHEVSVDKLDPSLAASILESDYALS